MKRKKIFTLLSLLFIAMSCSKPVENAKKSEEQKEQKEQTQQMSQEELKKHTKNAVETQDAFVQVYKNTKDSIVNIRTKKTVTVNTYNPLEELLFGRSGGVEKRESGALGSGFVVSEDGYIVTNNHVVSNADEIFVKFSDGREYRTKLIGTSPEVDIAVLKIEANEKFKPLEFSDSDKIEIGQWSIAFGNPMGLNDSMTVGVISASGRSSLGIEEIENFIQTDAAINQGNSGGPLIDINGKVIGVNTAILSTSGGSVGLGFAIPSNLASVVKDSIIATGKFEKPYIGVYLNNLDSEKMKAPAELTAFPLTATITSFAWIPALAAGPSATTFAISTPFVDLSVIRNSQTVKIRVTLEETPKMLRQQ